MTETARRAAEMKGGMRTANAGLRTAITDVRTRTAVAAVRGGAIAAWVFVFPIVITDIVRDMRSAAEDGPHRSAPPS